MRLFRGYRYLFYRTYVWQRGMFGEETNDPGFKAVLGNSLFVTFNLITLFFCFEIIAGYRMEIGKIYVIVGMIILILINIYIFLYRYNVNSLIAEFSSETEVERKKSLIWCWIYIIGTFVSFFGSVYILISATE